MQYDLVVIGAGPGGYSAALRAHRLGAKLLIIDNGELGGVCLNKGCIPTKTLLKSAMIYREVKKASLYGIDAEIHCLKPEKIKERKDKVISALKSGINAQLKAKGIPVIKGRAEITGIHEIKVNEEIISAENIIIATGSLPAKPPIKGIDDKCVIFSDEALSLGDIPASMVIIGGGVIGLEFATLFNEFGCKVSIVEMQDRVLPDADADISTEMKKVLTRGGIEIITSAKVTSINDGTVLFEKDDETIERYGEKVLVSIGRIPNVKGLFSEEIGLKLERGYIVTDNYMRTSISNIFAIGDVNGKAMLAHVATAEGVIAAENALGMNTEMSYKAIPKCVYTFPETAMVGLSEKEAIDSGVEIKVGKYPLRSNGRALADGSIEGFCKIISEKDSGKILGVHIVAPYATEMITEGTMAVQFGMREAELIRLIHPHPTVSEIIGEAVLNIPTEN